MQLRLIAFLALLLIVFVSFQNVFAYRMADTTAVVPTPTSPSLPIATDQPNGPPLSLTLMLGFTCCALSVVLGILILGFVLSLEGRKKDNEIENKAK